MNKDIFESRNEYKQAYEDCKKAYEILEEENIELLDKINGAVFDLDNLEQEIFGLDEYTNWIYNELDAIRMRLKGDEDENNK